MEKPLVKFYIGSSDDNIKKGIDLVTQSYERMRDLVDSKTERIKELEAELDKKTVDDRVLELQKENARLRATAVSFFNETESIAYDKAMKEHYESKCRSRIVYLRVEGTGLGTVYHVCCDTCGFRRDITDSSTW